MSDITAGAQPDSAETFVLFEFNDDIQWILGQMCFQCGSYARILRGSGRSIAKKAEAEQAAVIYWMLTMYQKHGKDEWRKKGATEMRKMAEALQQKEAANESH